jgi:prostaglandin-endoperoxide synthase 2
MGGDRANVQIGYTMINILFLREHNRLCDELRIAQPKWDDERLFQTARCMVTAMLLKIVVEEYINHITPYCFKFKLDPLSFCDADWYRQNWMTVEFNLLYRWHGLVTDEVHLGNSTIPVRETMFNNGILVDRGLGEVFEAASDQQSGEIGLFNTPEFLMPTERASIKLGRLSRLRSYNDYRALCSYPRVERFDQISSAPMVQKALKDLYKDVDQIELYVGLFAEDVRPHSVLAPLMGRMVGIDAFSQALTNPLLSKHVYNHRTYSDYGWQELENTRTLSDILNRNVPKRTPDYRVSFTQPGKSVC